MTGLLAKSPPHRRAEAALPYSCWLPGHVEQATDAAELVYELTKDAVAARFPQWLELYRKTLLLAALVHDLGKIGSLYQALFGPGERPKQKVRHEVVSDWLFVHRPEIREWLEQMMSDCSESERQLGYRAVRVAVLGHHFKWAPMNIQSSLFDGGFLRLPLNHPDWATLIRFGRERCGVAASLLPLAAEPIRLRIDSKGIGQIRAPLEEWVDDTDENLEPTERLWIAHVRSALTVADMIGSTRADTREEWLDKLAGWRKRLEQAAAATLLQQALAQPPAAGGGHPEIDAFQARVAREAASSGSTMLVESGCGTGKTKAAFHWGAAMGRRHMLICYPTTATVSQGFLDHLPLFGDEAAQMLHSRSEADKSLLDELKLLEQSDNPPEGEEEAYEPTGRADAIERLLHPITFCTADTVIGLLHNYRSSHLLFPAILNGCIVFDEAHAYDDKLWQGALKLMELLPTPVLIMTATLQPYRKAELAKACGKAGRRLRQIRGPAGLENLPKYCLQAAGGGECPIADVAAEGEAGRSVLVVLNTVDRAIRIWELLRERLSGQVELYLYHSRFKYEHRVDRQREVVSQARKRQGRGLIIVCTQICEISFDISVERLFSELAPLPACIQRLGRLYRYVRNLEDLGETAGSNAVFWMPGSALPYEQVELDETRGAFAGLPVPCSQRSLSKAMDTLQGQAHRHDLNGWTMLNKFLADSSTREVQSRTMDVALAADWNTLPRGKGNAVSAVEMMKKTLPLPFRRLEDDRTRWRHVRIVEDNEVEYDREKGGRWK